MSLRGILVSAILVLSVTFTCQSQPTTSARQSSAANAEPPKVIVPVNLDPSAPSPRGVWLFCDTDFKFCGLRFSEKERTSTFGIDDRQIRIGRSGSDFLIVVDTNGSRGLADEKRIRLANGSSVLVKIRKLVAPGRYVYLPFQISHAREEEGDKAFDSFKINPHYTAVGTVRVRDCFANLLLHDLNADGRFEPVDAKGGTNLGLDLNNDGKFWGREEFHTTNEIIEFCGRSYLVSEVSNARIVFEPTDLKIAKIGEAVPEFSITLLNGTAVTAENRKGRVYVMDFWASWCAPCVENLPEMVKLKEDAVGSINVYSVNVDEAGKQSAAREIIEKYRLGEFSAIRGLGAADPIWKTFGGINLNGLNIPLYVLIDQEGFVRYAGNGGKGLAELRNAIRALEAR